MRYLVVLLTITGVATSSSTGETWGYGESHGEVYGPSEWYKGYPDCGFNAQSPINIDTASVKPSQYEDELDIDFDNDEGQVVGTLSNNGHAPILTIDKPQGTAVLTGGPAMGDVFKLEQFHFHFGCSNDIGSEHTVNNNAYPAEVHFVFYNMAYGDFSEAADKSDGLVVVGVLFEVSSEANPSLERLAAKLEDIVDEGSSVAISQSDGIYLEDFLPDIEDDSGYYTYKGSLTTPACYQSVRWIVLEEKLPITKNQLSEFRKLHAAHGYAQGKMCNNFRPVQDLNGRTVSYII